MLYVNDHGTLWNPDSIYELPNQRVTFIRPGKTQNVGQMSVNINESSRHGKNMGFPDFWVVVVKMEGAALMREYWPVSKTGFLLNVQKDFSPSI